MSKARKEDPGFEQALAELEELVAKLESGDLSLDQSLAHFKRGVELTRHCQAILDQAQQTVELLSQESPKDTAESVQQ
jgi:exodeoxyribonuclease VII small subunit